LCRLSLELRDCDTVPERFLDPLLSLSSLRTLAAIEHAAFYNTLASLPLRELTLDAVVSSGAGLSKLSEMTRLVRLNLKVVDSEYWRGFGSSELGFIARLTRLQQFYCREINREVIRLALPLYRLSFLKLHDENEPVMTWNESELLDLWISSKRS